LCCFPADQKSGDLLELALREGHSFEIIAKPVHPIELLDWAALQVAFVETKR
jgi:hypothetical protein